MSATADRIEELRAEEAAAEQRAREADPEYWNTKADVARQNAEAVEDQVASDRRAASVAGQQATEDYTVAQQPLVDAMQNFISAAQAYKSAQAAYKFARSTAWSLEVEIAPVDGLAQQTIGSTGNRELGRLLEDFRAATASI